MPNTNSNGEKLIPNHLIRETLGKGIKERRMKMGLSQLSLANACGKQTATFIALAENGQRNISSASLMKIAYKLNTDPNTLLGVGSTYDIAFEQGYEKARKEIINYLTT